MFVVKESKLRHIIRTEYMKMMIESFKINEGSIYARYTAKKSDKELMSDFDEMMQKMSNPDKNYGTEGKEMALTLFKAIAMEMGERGLIGPGAIGPANINSIDSEIVEQG